jgi:hypothetical protein
MSGDIGLCENSVVTDRNIRRRGMRLFMASSCLILVSIYENNAEQ